MEMTDKKWQVGIVIFYYVPPTDTKMTKQLIC